jgi:uroporphyrinogen decarboxylase
MNKKERLEAVFANQEPDCVPAGFWFHYDSGLSPAETAEAHIKTFRETGVDVMKVMQDYIQRMDMKVQVPADWKKVTYPGVSSPVYQKMADVLKRILDALGSETLVFQTMYGAMKNAVFSYGDEMVMAHAREAPDLVADAIRRIAEAMCEWAEGFVALGAAGLYYTAQFTEPGRFTKEEWAQIVRPADIMVMKAAEARGGRNILHICGEPEYQFRTQPEWIVDYSSVIVNWSIKETGLSLPQGRELFKRPILGGMNNRGNILHGSSESISAEAGQIIAKAGKKGFMLGADCTIQGKGISHKNIRVAVDAAHNA